MISNGGKFSDKRFFSSCSSCGSIFPGGLGYKTPHYDHPRIRMNGFWNRSTENIDPELDPEAKNQVSGNFPSLEII